MQDYRNINGYIWFYLTISYLTFHLFFTPKSLISQKQLIVDTLTIPIGFGMPRNQSAGLSSSFDAFFLLKIKKMLTEQNWDWYRKKTSVLTGQ